MVAECGTTTQIGAGSILAAAAAALESGDRKAAKQFLLRPVLGKMIAILVRLDPALHPLLDEEPFAPMKCDITLVWPLEAPMPPRSVFSAFREVRLESARPEGSQLPFRG